jgi:anti-sigma B factor antagonist
MVGLRSMEITHKEIAPDTVVVTITGKVMMGPESEQITSLVDHLLTQAKRIIIFDIAGITKIDSTGMGRFISSYNQAAAGGGEIRMAGAPPFVFQAFHVCRLDTVFHFYASVDEARYARGSSDAECEHNFDCR